MADKIRILYVDDEPSLLDIGKVFLERSGDFIVSTALSAPEALRLLEQEQFDAIISDYQMPAMNGIQFLIEVRNSFGQIPFILFTGKGREEVVIQAINSGADFYLQKGGEPEAQFAELSHKVRQAALRNRAEDLLRKSEEKYQVIVNHALEAIMIIDSSANILFANPAAAMLVDIEDSSACIGKNALEIIAPESREAAIADLNSTMEGSDGYLAQYKIVTATSRERWVELIGKKLSFGSAPAVIVMFRDVTERKRAEDALVESEEKLRATIGQSMDGILIVDGDFCIIEWNAAQTAIYGYTREEMLGRPLWEFQFATLPKEKKSPAVLEKMKQSILDIHTSTDTSWMQPLQDFEVQCKDGRRKTVQTSTFPIVFRDITIFGSFSRDITERNIAEGTLLRVNQKINVLSQLTRQDLTTQIFILNSYLEMAKKQATGQDGIIKNIESGERAVRSIKEITEFTKDYQNMGEKPPKYQNVKLAFLFGLSHISIGEIRHSLETENLEVFADPLLEKAFQGMLENSVKHGGPVNLIRVSHMVIPDGVTIVFEDDGTGVPQDRKDRIFLRGEGARASVRGLFFVREILDITGITISETGEPGKGARFEMTVPKGMWRMTGEVT